MSTACSTNVTTGPPLLKPDYTPPKEREDALSHRSRPPWQRHAGHRRDARQAARAGYRRACGRGERAANPGRPGPELLGQGCGDVADLRPPPASARKQPNPELTRTRTPADREVTLLCA